MLDRDKSNQLVAQVRDAVFKEILRICPAKEKEQRALAGRLEEFAVQLVDEVAALVTLHGSWPALASKLSRIQDLDKQALVTLVLTDPEVDWTALHRAKLTGVTLVLADASQFDQERPEAPIERDQKTIFDVVDRTEPRREDARNRFTVVEPVRGPAELWAEPFGRICIGGSEVIEAVARSMNAFEAVQGEIASKDGMKAIIQARIPSSASVVFRFDQGGEPEAAPAPEATGPAPVREPEEDPDADPEGEDEEGEDGDELDAIEELIGPAAEPAPADDRAFDVVAELRAHGYKVLPTSKGILNIVLPAVKAGVRLELAGDGQWVPVVKSIDSKRVASDIGHERLERLDEYMTFLNIVAHANEVALKAVPVPSAEAAA